MTPDDPACLRLLTLLLAGLGGSVRMAVEEISAEDNSGENPGRRAAARRKGKDGR
ncbi:hypothetical protein ABZ707_22240 [Streptomyces sp. NPDC006923]|uniref:hypothetical protein n=1 Tax=Streptomyces sp. NPDC006923 TaxID=3155355 RepID=UPI00340F7655